LGANFVLFRDPTGQYGQIDHHCPHRGADLAFGRLENGGLRCSFLGSLFDTTGIPRPEAMCRSTKGTAA